MNGVVRPSSESQALLRWLQARSEPKKASPRASLNFIASLLEIFGQRYAIQVKAHLSKKTRGQFDLIHNAYWEIQKGLFVKGEVAYMGGQDFPYTAQVIQKYRDESQDDDAFFRVLKRRSYEIWPVPQKILISPTPDLRSLKAVEKVRDRALFLLANQLSSAIPQKESLWRPIEWTAEDEIAVAKLFFNGAAFYYRGRPVYFSELIKIWNPQAREALLNRLSLRHWVAEESVGQIDEFTGLLQNPPNTFKTFLIDCSILVVQKRLNIPFSQSIIKKLTDEFREEESIRSDVCCFIANLPQSYEKEVVEGRLSTPLLYSLQLFFYVVQNYWVKSQNRLVLLTMLLYKSSAWKWEGEKGLFPYRRWMPDSPDVKEDSGFASAWAEFEKVLISINAPSEELFVDRNAWPSFMFLWQHPRRDLFVQVFCALAQDPRFAMSLPLFYRFCKANEKSLMEGMAVPFIDLYREILQVLDNRGIGIVHAEKLFLDPPIEISEISLDAKNRAERFVECMKTYDFPIGDRYFSMMNRFIFHPFEWVFGLLRDILHLGVQKLDEEVLWQIFSMPLEPLESEDSKQFAEAREKALNIARKIQEKYQFSEAQIFFIYLETIRLALAKKEEVMGSICQLVYELENFCYMHKKDIYFLFRYHPENALAPFLEIVNWRAEFARSNQLTRFIIDQRMIRNKETPDFGSSGEKRPKAILDLIEGFATFLSKYCQEELKSSFWVGIQRSLVSGCLPPMQGLIDYFRITDLTVEGGIHWGQSIWNTHLGQLKSVWGKASLKTYFHWIIHDDHPVLFFSFFDVKKKEAFSAFLPLYMPLSELDTDGRQLFFTFLCIVTQHVFNEDSKINLNETAPEIPASWIPCFDGLSESLEAYSGEVKMGNLKPEHVNMAWEFLQRVKVAFRASFYYSVAGRRPPPFSSYEPVRVAALGRICPFQGRTAALPSTLLESVASNKDFYLPDASEDFLKECVRRKLFSEPTKCPQPLHLNLKVAPGEERPIFYAVQTADRLSQERLDQKEHWNERAPSREEVQGTYVTLSISKEIQWPLRYPPEALSDPKLFQEFFDFHNLLLKIHYYYAIASGDFKETPIQPSNIDSEQLEIAIQDDEEKEP